MFKAFSTVLAFLLVYMDFTGQYWITQVHAAETTSGMQGSSYGADFSGAMNESGQFTDSTGQSVEIDPYELFGFEKGESGSPEPWSSIESTYGNDSAIESLAEQERQSAMSSPETDAQQDWANLLETTKEAKPDQENDAALQTSWEMIRALDTGVTSCSSSEEDSLSDEVCYKSMPAQYDSCSANRQWSTESFERDIEVKWKMRRWTGRYVEYDVWIPEFGLSGGAYWDTGSERQWRDYENSAKAIKNRAISLIKQGLEREFQPDAPGQVQGVSLSVTAYQVGFYGGGWYSTYTKDATVRYVILKNDSWRTEECLNKLDEFRTAVNEGYGVGTRVCSREQAKKSNGCANFDGVEICNGELPLPSQIDDMPFNCTQVSFEGAYHGDQMPEFSGEQSCEDLASDPSCSLNTTDECQSYYPDGTCAFYKNEYICGYGKTDTCSTQQEVMDLFPECTTDYETQSVTDTYLFSDPKTCEVIHEKTASCNRVRDGEDSGWWTQHQFLDTYTESSDDPLNSPCQDEDDGFTSVSWTCTQRLSVFEAQYGPYEPLYPGGNGTCVKAEANYDTYFYKENNPTGPWDLNTCDVMEANSCVLTRGPSCVDGATNDIGQCYLEEYTYECGEEVQVTNTDIKREYQCGQELSCMGSDCTQATTESGMADFSEAVAMTQLMEAFSGDAQCDPENPGDCVLFSGEYMWCKKVLGGAQNCCDGPSGPSLTDYITMLRAGRKGLEALQNVEQFSSMSQPITGAWNYMKDGATSAYDAASKPVMQTWDKLSNRLFTSAPENVEAITSTAESGIQVAGEAGAGADAAASEGFIAGVKQKVANASAEFVGNTFGEGAKSAMFSGEAGNYTLGGEGAFLGNALNFIMAAYMYYAIAMMIIQVVWSCEDIEFELSAKRDLKVCTKIGSWCEVDGGVGCVEKREGFCCFSSPLSRIMNEQIRQQTGNSYGDPEGPNCEGITVDTIQTIDWSQIDLSEWIAILSTTGNMPSPDVDEMMQQYSSGAITGSSSTMANDTNRANVLERTEQRLDESSPNLIEAEMSDGLHQDVERKAQ
jgi:hypothetical protein